MLKRISLATLALLTLFVIGGVGFWQFNKSPMLFEPSVGGLYHQEPRTLDPTSERETQTGRVVGFADNYNTQAWLGIPFAAPPVDHFVGELRARLQPGRVRERH